MLCLLCFISASSWKKERHEPTGAKKTDKETTVDKNSTHFGWWNRWHLLLDNTQKRRIKSNKTPFKYIAEARGNGMSHAPKMERNCHRELNTQEGWHCGTLRRAEVVAGVSDTGGLMSMLEDGLWLWPQEVRELEVGHPHKGRVPQWKGGPECHPLVDGGNKKYLSFSTWVWVWVLPTETSPHTGLGFKQNLFL